ncbi:hypothetical protein PAPHI01_2144 [Pancytospora philotis]|nr:hypothetical protein PAPHI01_2144 [Pancytospora philotis]
MLSKKKESGKLTSSNKQRVSLSRLLSVRSDCCGMLSAGPTEKSLSRKSLSKEVCRCCSTGSSGLFADSWRAESSLESISSVEHSRSRRTSFCSLARMSLMDLMELLYASRSYSRVLSSCTRLFLITKVLSAGTNVELFTSVLSLTCSTAGRSPKLISKLSSANDASSRLLPSRGKMISSS